MIGGGVAAQSQLTIHFATAPVQQLRLSDCVSSKGVISIKESFSAEMSINPEPPFVGAIFVLDMTAEEGQESVLTMIPKPPYENRICGLLHKIRSIIAAIENVSEMVTGSKVLEAIFFISPFDFISRLFR
jgi:hypothetical protein